MNAKKSLYKFTTAFRPIVYKANWKIQIYKQKTLSYISLYQKHITETRYVIRHWWKNRIDFM